MCLFRVTNLTAGVKVASQATASGDSPALGQGVALEQAAPRLVLPYLPYESGGASAPVLVNVTDETASVTLRFVGGQVLDPVTVTIPPRSPLADVTTNLFPGLSTSGYMEAESNVPLVGAAFNFNALREPSMAIAQVQSTLSEEDLDGLISSLETSATLMNSYATSSSGLFKQSACPEVDVDINLNNQSSFITGHFDWGSGCTNVLGVYHSGSIDLTMQREGTIQTGGWMNGSLVMDNFTTKYLGSSAAFNGSAHAEGSTKSQNFTLSGSWSASADVPAYYLHASFSSSTYLSVNHKSDHYEAYGSFQVKYQTYYYGSIVAEVAQNDPLIYDFETCIWPTDGKLMLTLQYGIPLTGSLDFGTGDCNTAVLTVNGVSQTLYLPGIYTKQ